MHKWNRFLGKWQHWFGKNETTTTIGSQRIKSRGPQVGSGYRINSITLYFYQNIPKAGILSCLFKNVMVDFSAILYFLFQFWGFFFLYLSVDSRLLWRIEGWFLFKSYRVGYVAVKFSSSLMFISLCWNQAVALQALFICFMGTFSNHFCFYVRHFPPCFHFQLTILLGHSPFFSQLTSFECHLIIFHWTYDAAPSIFYNQTTVWPFT